MRKLFLFLSVILFLEFGSATSIFLDDFESGGLSGWTLSNAAGANNWTVSTTNPFQGSWHAQSNPRSTSEPASVLQRTVSTVGYQNIFLNYSRRLIGLDVADEFQVEWYNGTAWNVLEQTGSSGADDVSYLSRNFSIGSAASNNANFAIKFECTAGAVSEFCRVDNVNVSGELIPDSDAPNLSIVFPTNTTYATDVGELNYSVRDANLQACRYSLNGGVTNTTIVCGQNASGLISSEGSNTWSVYANDSAGNVNSSSVTFFKDSIVPLISYGVGTEVDGANVSRNWIYVNVSVIELNEVNVTFRLFNSSGAVNQTTFSAGQRTINWTGLSDGTYTYNVSMSDSANNVNTTMSRVIVLDRIAPLLNVVSPANASNYSSSPINVSYSVSDTNLRACWWSNSSGLINRSIGCGSNITGQLWDEGINVVLVYANDSAGNVNETSVRFLVDTLAPLVNLLAPSNNTLTRDSLHSFNASFNDSVGLANSTFYLWNVSGSFVNVTTVSITSAYNTTNLSVALPYEGRFFWNYFASDIFGRSTFNTSNFSMLYDKTNPLLNYVGPTLSSGLFSNQDFIEVNMSASDANFANITIQLYNFSGVLLQSNSSSGSVFYINYSRLNDGLYFYNASAVDSVSNVNYSTTRNITLDTTMPIASYGVGTESDGANVSRNWIYVNVSVIELNEVNVTFRLFNSSGAVNQTTYGVGQRTINWTGLSDGTYTYNVSVSDSANNVNTTMSRVIVLDRSAPSVVLFSPQNISYTNVSLLVNISSNGLNVWFYNGSGNESYSAPVYRVFSYGAISVIAYANDSAGNLNETSVRFSVLPNFTVSCESGGPYQQGAVVLFQGNVSNETSPLLGQSVNVSVFSGGLVVVSRALITGSDGSFETTLNGLSVGGYVIHANTSYYNTSGNCIDSFLLGSQGSFVLDKIASISALNDSTITYNISLVLVNNGGANVSAANLSDGDSASSPYMLGAVVPGGRIERSYQRVFNRENSTLYVSLNVSSAYGLDSYSNQTIVANSTQLNVSIPSRAFGNQLVIVKNVQYVTQASLNVTYNVSVGLSNTGDNDLSGISYVDSDINSSAVVFSAGRGSSYAVSQLVVVAKAASNVQYQFALGSVSIGNSTFYSNRPSVIVPGYGGPADALVDAPSSVGVGNSFSSRIEVRNMNPDIGQDFSIDYWITSVSEDTNYSSGQQTVYVGALGSVNVSAQLSAPSSVGMYRLYALVRWVGESARSFDSFEVTSSLGGGDGGGGGSGGGGSGGGSGGGFDGSGGGIERVANESSTVREEVVREEREEIVCNVPYIRYGKECCLDVDANSICDVDEQPRNESSRGITGFSIRDIGVAVAPYVRAFLLLFVLLAILLLSLMLYRRMRRKDSSRLRGVIGLKVYTMAGVELGVVKDIFVEKHKVHSLKIKLLRRKRFRIKGIILPYKHVRSSKMIVLVDERVLDEVEGK